jgi:tRNA(Ile)-lysidine synthase
MPERKGAILRPLLTLERGEICRYLSERRISWREDSSNTDERFLRNRVRLRLVPLLDEHFPGWRGAVAALAETQALTAEFLAAEAARRINWDEDAEGKLSCTVSRFAEESQIIREEALFAVYDRISAACNSAGNGADEPPPPSAPPRRAPLRDFARNISGGGKDAPALTLGGMNLRVKDGTISAAPEKQTPSEECASILINKPGLYRFKNFSIECIAGDGAEINCRFILRPASPASAY